MKKFTYSSKAYYTNDEINNEVKRQFNMSLSKHDLIKKLVNNMTNEEKLDYIRSRHRK
tara:strand:+ start:1581 stop:1754 length:174 start_codon:yes stop_codon:yes gene_type:complete